MTMPTRRASTARRARSTHATTIAAADRSGDGSTSGARPAVAAVLAAVLLLGGALSGCSHSGTRGAPGTASCLPAQPTGSAQTTQPAQPTEPARYRLPDLALPCLGGGTPVRLSRLGRPLVVNLWASWCTPCRAELPAIQRYSATSGVTVLGVDTADTRTGGTAVVADLGLTFPTLVDEHKSLLSAVGRSTLPVTLFVDAGGAVRYVYAEATALTEAAVAALATTYLGAGG